MTWLLVVAIVLTSVVACLAGVRHLGLSVRSLPAAAGTLLECIGLAVVFSVLNIGVATTVVVLIRALGAGFVSAYVTGDAVWLVFSFLQAVMFQLWRASKPAS